LENPETLRAPEMARVEGPVRARPARTKPVEEETGVERLLAQLEAGQMALVPYRYLKPPAPTQKSNLGLIIGTLGVVWMSTMVLAIVYITSRPAAGVSERTNTTPIVIRPTADPEPSVANSVDNLAKSLAASSARLNQLEATVEKSNRDLERFKTNASGEPVAAAASHAKASPPAPQVSAPLVAHAPAPNVQPAPPQIAPPAVTAAAVPDFPVLAQPTAQGPKRIGDVKPVEGAVPHKRADGKIDYWLVGRGAFKELTKVVPIAVSSDGVVVHNLADGKNYTLTPQGEWREPEW
jgi:hypothetical protein